MHAPFWTADQNYRSDQSSLFSDCHRWTPNRWTPASTRGPTHCALCRARPRVVFERAAVTFYRLSWIPLQASLA
jgi:hypothetical protein